MTRAVNSITSEDVRSRIGILADDSMLGRATPSPQLEEVASYIAEQFQRFGLKPGAAKGSYVQRYPLSVLALDAESSAVRATGVAGVALAAWHLGADLLYLRGALPSREVAGSVVLITGQGGDAARAAPSALKGKVVVLLHTAGGRTLLPVIGGAHPAAVLLATTVSESVWQRAAAAQARPRIRYGAPEAASPPILLIREAAVLPLVAQAGVAFDSGSAQLAPFRALELPTLTIHVRLRQRDTVQHSAPNVIGILEGSDPQLKHEYLFFTAHMDHLGTPGAGEGCTAHGADSICNGADDDASGTTAVIGAAQAFSHLVPPPKRSLVFMTVSGEERGLWGSTYFVDHPTVPLARVVADLNADMVGRNWKDTIAVIGKEHSDLGATLNQVAAAHPELHMTPIDDIWPQEDFYFRSDHYNFARKGVPILFFFNGTHADYHQVGDSPDKIDAEKESRIIKLMFYVGLQIANAPDRPKWNPASYRRIVQGAP